MGFILGNMLILLIVLFLYAILDNVAKGIFTRGIFKYITMILLIIFAVLASQKYTNF
ncbi:positive regulator of sigma E activity [Natronobacillus azotifigens]